MNQSPSKPGKGRGLGATPRTPRAPLAGLGPERHSGEGADSAWETWNELERQRSRTRGDEENALAPPGRVRKPEST